MYIQNIYIYKYLCIQEHKLKHFIKQWNVLIVFWVEIKIVNCSLYVIYKKSSINRNFFKVLNSKYLIKMNKYFLNPYWYYNNYLIKKPAVIYIGVGKYYYNYTILKNDTLKFCRHLQCSFYILQKDYVMIIFDSVYDPKNNYIQNT